MSQLVISYFDFPKLIFDYPRPKSKLLISSVKFLNFYNFRDFNFEVDLVSPINKWIANRLISVVFPKVQILIRLPITTISQRNHY